MIFVEAIDVGHLELTTKTYNPNQNDPNSRRDRPWMLDILDELVKHQVKLVDQFGIDAGNKGFEKIWNKFLTKRQRFLDIIAILEKSEKDRTKLEKKMLKGARPQWYELEIGNLNKITLEIIKHLKETSEPEANEFEQRYLIGIHVLGDGLDVPRRINVVGVCNWNEQINPVEYKDTYDQFWNDPQKIYQW